MTQKDEALRMAIEKLLKAAKHIQEILHHPTKSVTILDSGKLDDAIENYEAALSEPETVTLPDGWVPIPVEADYNQIDAIVKELRICRARLLKTAARCIYDTVISSAPKFNEKG